MAIAIIVFLFLMVVGVLAYLIDGLFGGLDFATSRLVTRQIIEIIRQHNLEHGNFYDLGSARGGFAITIARSFPELNVVGIDNSHIRTWCAKIRSLFLKNAHFKTQNIFKADISSANIIYLYLPQELMPDLEKKLQKELKPGAIIISASVSFPSWPPLKTYDLTNAGLTVPKVFVYLKN